MFSALDEPSLLSLRLLIATFYQRTFSEAYGYNFSPPSCSLPLSLVWSSRGYYSVLSTAHHEVQDWHMSVIHHRCLVITSSRLHRRRRKVAKKMGSFVLKMSPLPIQITLCYLILIYNLGLCFKYMHRNTFFPEEPALNSADSLNIVVFSLNVSRLSNTPW